MPRLNIFFGGENEKRHKLSIMSNNGESFRYEGGRTHARMPHRIVYQRTSWSVKQTEFPPSFHQKLSITRGAPYFLAAIVKLLEKITQKTFGSKRVIEMRKGDAKDVPFTF